MISTVTTSTVTTVTTMIGFGMALGVVAVIALLAFLGARELATTSESSSQRFLARSLEVAIAPLVIAFVVIVAMKMVEIILA